VVSSEGRRERLFSGADAKSRRDSVQLGFLGFPALKDVGVDGLDLDGGVFRGRWIVGFEPVKGEIYPRLISLVFFLLLKT
ncbi:hypothetical protein PJP13_29540, partial [Mycobacterium kansasii]